MHLREKFISKGSHETQAFLLHLLNMLSTILNHIYAFNTCSIFVNPGIKPKTTCIRDPSLFYYNQHTFVIHALDVLKIFPGIHTSLEVITTDYLWNELYDNLTSIQDQK